jgi:hypothetical protein
MVGLQSYIALKKTISGIVEPPLGSTPTAVNTWLLTTTNIAGDNLIVYYPWVKINDPITGVVTSFPPGGFAQGRWAAVDTTRNVAKAPAGTVDGKLQGVIGVERKLTLPGDYDIIYPNGVNAILSLPEGILLFGSRTLGSASQLRQIAKRRTMNFSIRSIERGTRFVLFENNDTPTRARWRRSVQGFLLTMWKAGMLDGVKASEAFYVICDENNNPSTIIRAGKFKGKVGLHFKGTVEFAEYEFEEDLRALAAELAAAGL